MTDESPHDDLFDESGSEPELPSKAAYLIHRVFAQTEDGKAVLKEWMEEVTMLPSADVGMDYIGIGIQEGRKKFVREIQLIINRVEAGE